MVWVSSVVVSACVANERLRHGGWGPAARLAGHAGVGRLFEKMRCRAASGDEGGVEEGPDRRGRSRPHSAERCTGAGLFSASANQLVELLEPVPARKLDTSERQRATCSTAMISALRFAGAFPVATACAWPAMKVYQP